MKNVIFLGLLFISNSDVFSCDYFEYARKSCVEPSLQDKEQLLLEQNSWAQRNGDNLELKLKKSTKIYTNHISTAHGTLRKKILTASYRTHQNRQFALIYIEDIPSYFELLDFETGAITTLHNYPVFSADNHRFIHTSFDIEIGELYNIVEVFKITADGFTKEWKFEYKEGLGIGPTQPIWLNNSEFIYFETYFANIEESMQIDKKPIMVKLTNNKWMKKPL